MRNISAGVIKTSKTNKNAEQLRTPVCEEENAKTKKNVFKQKPAKAELLKRFVYKDVGPHLGNAVECDVNSNGPMRKDKFDYGYRKKRNMQWVQYLKPEILPRCIIEPESRNSFCAKVFGLVFMSFLITESIAVTTYVVPEVAVVLKGVIGLGLLMGSIFVFLLSFYIMCLSCSKGFPCNFCCYVLLFAASSIVSGVIVAHGGGIEMILTNTVIAGIIFLFWMMSYGDVDMTAPYFYVMAVTLVLGSFGFGAYLISHVLRIKITLVHIFMALTYSIFYVICAVLQVQMILTGKGIELTSGDWIFGAATVFISIVFVFKNILQMIHQYNLI